MKIRKFGQYFVHQRSQPIAETTENTETSAVASHEKDKGVFRVKEFKDLKQEWLKDPKVKKAYLDMKPEFEVASTLIAARAKAKLTQAELAKRMGTTQSVVSRIESGSTLPSIKTLYSYAKAVGAKPTIRIDPI